SKFCFVVLCDSEEVEWPGDTAKGIGGSSLGGGGGAHETVMEVSSSKEVVDPGTDWQVAQLDGDSSGGLGKFWFLLRSFFSPSATDFRRSGEEGRHKVPRQIAKKPPKDAPSIGAVIGGEREVKQQ
ncbi:hypothetical protein U1Q18_016090, partial [Sarracenia purpurea var. burkii]